MTRSSRAARSQRDLAVLALLMGLALLLRWPGLATQPLLGTEITLVEASRHTLWENLRIPPPVGVFMMPLQHGLARLSTQLWPDAFGLRLPSLVAGLLAVPLLALVGRELGSRRLGLVAAGLLAVCPVHVLQSQLAKYYTGMLALGLASLALSLRLCERPRPATAVALALVTWASVCNHLGGAFWSLGNLLLVVLLAARGRAAPGALRMALAAAVVAALLYAPYLPWTWRSVITNPEIGPESGDIPRLHGDLRLLWDLSVLYGPGNTGRAWAWLLLALVGLGSAMRRPDGLPLALLPLTHVAVPLAVYVGFSSGQPFDGEHLFGSVGVEILLVGAGILATASRLPWPRATTAALALGCALAALPGLWASHAVESLRPHRAMAHLQLAQLALAAGNPVRAADDVVLSWRFVESHEFHQGRLAPDQRLPFGEAVTLQAIALRKAQPGALAPGQAMALDDETRAGLAGLQGAEAEFRAYARWALAERQDPRQRFTRALRWLAGEGGGDAAAAAGLRAAADGDWATAAALLVQAPTTQPETALPLGIALCRAGRPESGLAWIQAGIARLDAMYAYAPQKVDNLSAAYREPLQPFENVRIGYGVLEADAPAPPAP